MELEALRKQLTEEISGQFDARLRELKRQKSQLEEEFEVSSEKWRTERRRLNSEIDRLEAALAESRQSGRDSSEPRIDEGVDPQEILKLQAAAEEKIKEAAQVWEKERTRLQTEVSRLQESIAEQIERSNNPLRANPIERGKLESKYEDAVRAKRQAEDALSKAKGEWEAEKLVLIAESKKTRPTAAPSPATATRKPDDQLEKKLQESNRLQESLVADLEKARLELARLKEAHAAELQSLAARLQSATAEWEAEKLALVNEVTKLRQAPSGGPAPSDDQLDKQLKEAVRVRDSLASDLEKTRNELSRVEKTHAAENQSLTTRLQSAKTEWEAEKLALVSEVAKLRQAPPTPPANAPRKVDDPLDKRLQETVKVRDGLASDLEKIKNEMAKLKETHSTELKDFTSRYIQTRTDLEKQVKDSEDAKGTLERELKKARETSSQQKGAGSEEATRLKTELDGKTKEVAALNARLAATKGAVGSDVVTNLQHQFDARIQELMQENSRLAEKARNAASQAAGAGSAAPPGGSGNNGNAAATLDSSTIDEEMKRVEALTTEIAKLIDDPETELATVIRKNVERAALESYLKGILFSLGRGKKL